MALEIHLVTLFPEFFRSPLRESLIEKAEKKGLVTFKLHDLRKFTHDRHRTADDKPFGGGAGMVMKPEPVFECVEAIREPCWKILLGPHGKPFEQCDAERLAGKNRLVLIAGHYEGIDYRVRENLVDEEISIGDFITMGGEAPALCVIEAVIRLVPGVLGNSDSVVHESFQTGLLEYPQYTRPRKFRSWEVPDVLISGNHQEVEKWRRETARNLTRKYRPDLLRRKK